eukprot:3035758-Pleurochrysis_carterae.AAC.1
MSQRISGTHEKFALKRTSREDAPMCIWNSSLTRLHSPFQIERSRARSSRNKSALSPGSSRRVFWKPRSKSAGSPWRGANLK